MDSDRIGLAGWSLGGYYCPRAAAFEKRIKFVAVWGANHNWGEVQKKRLQRDFQAKFRAYINCGAGESSLAYQRPWTSSGML